jgi:hypothetical protein
MVALLARVQDRGCRVALFSGRTIGAGFLRLEGDDTAVLAAIGDLRASGDVGHVVVLGADPRLKQQIDVWGPSTGTAEVARVLKRKFDPQNILNAGRGPI